MTAIEESQEQVVGVEGTEDWIAVAHDSDSEGWDWSAISFYYSPSARRYFWYRDGGCSCNWHMDMVSGIGEFEDGDRQAAIAEAQSFSTECETEVRAFKEPK